MHLSIIDRSSGIHLAVLQGHTLVMSTSDRISDITSNPGFLDRMFFLVGQQKTATLSVPKGSYLSLLIAAAPLSSESSYRLIAYSEASNAELLLNVRAPAASPDSLDSLILCRQVPVAMPYRFCYAEVLRRDCFGWRT